MLVKALRTIPYRRAQMSLIPPYAIQSGRIDDHHQIVRH